MVRVDNSLSFLILRGKLSVFPIFMLAVCFSLWVFIMLKYVPCKPTLLKVFIMNGCYSLSNAFSVSIEMIMFFILSFVDVMYHD